MYEKELFTQKIWQFPELNNMLTIINKTTFKEKYFETIMVK